MINVPSPHHSSRQGHDITCCVFHYTGGGRASGTARWFGMKESRVSAHHIVGRDGKLYQCVDHERAAWHAGMSMAMYHGKPTDSVNLFSIGIELANRGLLLRKGWSFYYRFGGTLKKYRGPKPVFKDGAYWEPYTQLQIDATKDLIIDISKKHSKAVQHLLGHNEIAPGRKIDPGPLFPWGEFR